MTAPLKVAALTTALLMLLPAVAMALPENTGPPAALPESAKPEDSKLPDLPSLRATFNEKELASYHVNRKLKKDETASLSGQIFLVTKGGEPRYDPGRVVFLIPRTAYTAEWIVRAVKSELLCKKNSDSGFSVDRGQCLSFLLGLPDKRLEGYIRLTPRDPSGRFLFRKVPPGNYFIVGLVTWHVVGDMEAGGIAVEIVEVEPGEHVTDVIVTSR